MLRLLEYDKAFIPAKRNYDRKPLSKVAFTDGKMYVHNVTISNN